MTDPLLKYREQHKHRLKLYAWLYWSFETQTSGMGEQWQGISSLPDGNGNGGDWKNCFISPLAHILLSVVERLALVTIPLSRRIVPCMDRCRLAVKWRSITTVF